MKVLTIGSTADEKDLAELDRFVKLLGGVLARRGHQIVVLSNRDKDIDRAVLEGYANAKPTIPVLISSGDKDDDENVRYKFEEIKREYPKLRCEHLQTHRRYPLNRVEIARRVDSIILVGGHDGTKQFGEIAFALDKPILPLPFFDGEAKKAWEQLAHGYKGTLSDLEYQAIDDPSPGLDVKRVEIIVDAAERLAKDSDRAEPRISLVLLICTELTCVVVWFLLHNTAISINTKPEYLLGGLLVTSSIIGVLLRSLVRCFLSDIKNILLSAFLAELGLGIGLSFAFFLLSQIGGSMLADNLDQSMTDDPYFFRKLGFILSTLSVGVAFLLEQSIARLRTGLETAIRTTSFNQKSAAKRNL
jgi:hypothetical protein